MAVKKILQIGDPKLKTENSVITDFSSRRLKRLIKDLTDTMYKTGLIGIAAPQIGRNENIYITHPRKTQYRKNGNLDELRIFINPEITRRSRKTSVIYEGCGCVGTSKEISVFGPVKRSSEIEVKAHDETGKRFRLRCDGILARVIQHEQDHLEGVEFLERVTDNKHFLSREFYIKKVKNSENMKALLTITKKEYRQIIK